LIKNAKIASTTQPLPELGVGKYLFVAPKHVHCGA
jgi:hypothetical protein